MNPKNEWETNVPADFQSELNRVRSSVAPAASLQRFMLAAEEIERTVSVIRRTWIIANLCAIVGCFCVAIGAAVLTMWSKGDLLMASILVAYAFFMSGFLLGLIRWVRDTRAAGPVLMDCGRLHTKSFSFLLLSLLPLSIVFLTCVDFSQLPWHYWVAGVAFCIPVAVYFISLARGRLLVCANGIWHYIGFLPWHEIESWGWSENSPSALIIQKSGYWAIFRSGVLPVPSEQKDRFEEYLRQYCITQARHNDGEDSSNPVP